jgi:hypothetical protein
LAEAWHVRYLVWSRERLATYSQIVSQLTGDKGTIMRKVVWWALVLWIALNGEAAMAQQAGKIYRVGVLSVRGGMEERDEVFRKRLNELGYIEEKNLIVTGVFGCRANGPRNPVKRPGTCGQDDQMIGQAVYF